jgi:hypothetical protein
MYSAWATIRSGALAVTTSPTPSARVAARRAADSRSTPAERKRSQRDSSDIPPSREWRPVTSPASTGRIRTVEPSRSATSTGCATTGVLITCDAGYVVVGPGG